MPKTSAVRVTSNERKEPSCKEPSCPSPAAASGVSTFRCQYLYFCAGRASKRRTWHDLAERFFFAPEFVNELRALEVGPMPHPEQIWALIAKGDEVLDWREMTARYPDSPQVVIAGGDHALSNFETYLPQVLEFLDLQAAA
jgi:hypothetical protein